MSKKIIVNKNSETIVFIGIKADIEENGINTGDTVYCMPEIYSVFDIEVPNNVIPQKYCYNTEKGFYLNPSFQENISENNAKAIQEQINSLSVAMANVLGI